MIKTHMTKITRSIPEGDRIRLVDMSMTRIKIRKSVIRENHEYLNGKKTSF